MSLATLKDLENKIENYFNQDFMGADDDDQKISNDDLLWE
jgi:hypothetical protein